MTLRPDGALDPVMFHSLKTAFSLDDALDLLEIDDVGQSWRAAVMKSNDARREG